ncbi:MAG: ionic transporter y4hA [Pseudolysinimonas sp.]|uniref:calcium:proton antiporter n=1 Tax=Pseudolysinimonas sp. TaxID=2680009 RepID=UPI003C71A834
MERPLAARWAATVGNRWVVAVPAVAVVALVLTWDRQLEVVAVVLTGVLLIGAVLAAVHHAEVVAHRVGEPFGSLILAVSVTVIEVALIITLMVGGKGTETLARDTAFAAVMITLNGIVGISLLLGGLRHGLPRFNAEGAGAALAVVVTLVTLTLVLPSFTISEPGDRFSEVQLAFVAIVSLLLYAGFVATQTRGHRDFFLPVGFDGKTIRQPADDADGDGHADPPSNRATAVSGALLLLSLVAVVGLAKAVSPAIEAGVSAAGIPHAFVGIVIASLVLLPEGLAASKAALRNRMQTSLNLGIGSAIASIGLTIPAIAVASIWLPGPLTLGLGDVQLVLFGITVVVSILTIVPGRATRLAGVVHLVLLLAFVFLAISP